MRWKKPPLSVTILACVYMVVGTLGFVAHLPEIQAKNAFQGDGVWVELVELVAIVCGVFMLRGHNWARWVALSWIAFHIVVSAFHTWREVVVHSLFCAVIAWVLFRPAAAKYFYAVRVEPHQ